MNQKRNEGITLIALVITIIILLILAGVTLSMVLGDEGIIKQAEAAKEQQKEAALKEEIEMYKGELEVESYGGLDARTWEKFVTDLYGEKNIITENEKNELLDENDGEITVGDTTISKEDVIGDTTEDDGDVDEEIVATSLEIAGPYDFLSAGGAYATMTSEIDIEPSGAKVTWISSNPSIATVDENGVVTALAGASGDVTITATSGEKKDEYTVTVGEVITATLWRLDTTNDDNITAINGMTWFDLYNDSRFENSRPDCILKNYNRDLGTDFGCIYTAGDTVEVRWEDELVSGGRYEAY